jgi:hypothetical protein
MTATGPEARSVSSDRTAPGPGGDGPRRRAEGEAFQGASPEDSPEHAYFRALEETFIRLRGAPLLLSPADWRVASAWYSEGIPLTVVVRALEEVFARRRERGAKGRIQSLRYCAPAVAAAWEEIRSLTAPGRQAEAEPLLVAPRLAALAAALPAELEDRQGWARRITALAGGTEEVEAALADLDRELLGDLEATQEPGVREQLAGEMEAALARLATRLGDRELEEARGRLLRLLLRQRLGLPVLSLFSPEAEPPTEA